MLLTIYLLKKSDRYNFKTVNFIQFLISFTILNLQLLFTLMDIRLKTKVSIVLLTVLLTLTHSQSTFYQKVIHNTDPEAKCLDGSSPFLYIHEGA